MAWVSGLYHATVWYRPSFWALLLRAKPSKGGDAEPRGFGGFPPCSPGRQRTMLAAFLFWRRGRTMNFSMKLGALMAASVLVLGCGIGSAGPVIDRIDHIDVSPGRFTLLTSQSAELQITVTTSRGDGGGAEQLVWSTTGGVISSNAIIGNVRRITYQAPPTPGIYLLIVTTATGAPADTASFTVTNSIVSVSGISVSPTNVTFVVGDTSRLRATLYDSTGAVLVGRPITWNSSDNGIVTVLATGQIRGIAAGGATITATNESHNATATITVNSAP
jgi:hypothetical protein